MWSITRSLPTFLFLIFHYRQQFASCCSSREGSGAAEGALRISAEIFIRTRNNAAQCSGFVSHSIRPCRYNLWAAVTPKEWISQRIEGHRCQGHAQPPKEPGWHVLALCSEFFFFGSVLWTEQFAVQEFHVATCHFRCWRWLFDLCVFFVQYYCFRWVFSFHLLSCKFMWIRQLYKLLFWPEGERNLIGQRIEKTRA